MHEREVKESRGYRGFKREAEGKLLEWCLQKVEEEKQESYVQISVKDYTERIAGGRKTGETVNNAERPNTSALSNRTTNNSRIRQTTQNGFSSEHGPSSNSINNCDELNIDELLATSRYIYLEEHNKFETYDFSKVLVLSSFIDVEEDAFLSAQSRQLEESKQEKFMSCHTTHMINDTEDDQQCLNNLYQAHIANQEVKVKRSFPLDKENVHPNTQHELIQLNKGFKTGSLSKPLSTTSSKTKRETAALGLKSFSTR